MLWKLDTKSLKRLAKSITIFRLREDVAAEGNIREEVLYNAGK